MGEYVGASIAIGGKLKREKFKEFIDLIYKAGLQLDFGDSPLRDYDQIDTPEQFMSLVHNSDTNGILRLSLDEANYGQMGIEDYLKEHGFSYVKHVDGKAGFNPCVEIFTLDGCSMEVTLNHGFYADLNRIVNILRSGKTLEALQVLDRLFPSSVQLHPAFTIADAMDANSQRIVKKELWKEEVASGFTEMGFSEWMAARNP